MGNIKLNPEEWNKIVGSADGAIQAISKSNERALSKTTQPELKNITDKIKSMNKVLDSYTQFASTDTTKMKSYAQKVVDEDRKMASQMNKLAKG